MRVLLETPFIVARCDDEARVATMVRSPPQLPREPAGLQDNYPRDRLGGLAELPTHVVSYPLCN